MNGFAQTNYPQTLKKQAIPLNYNVQISLNEQQIKREKTIIDCHLNWKSHISETSKKIRRNIGIIFKLRSLVNTSILKNLYYSLIYPYLTYGIVAWGNTVVAMEVLIKYCINSFAHVDQLI